MMLTRSVGRFIRRTLAVAVSECPHSLHLLLFAEFGSEVEAAGFGIGFWRKIRMHETAWKNSTLRPFSAKIQRNTLPDKLLENGEGW